MADLPIELWHSIFDHFELTDLCLCAQISKAVYIALKEYRVREIAFTGGVCLWFHERKLVSDHKYELNFTKVSILKRSSFSLDYLKWLKIGRSSDIDLNVINQFVHLEELDIDLANYENKKNKTLSLANLKLLYVFVPDHLPYVELDTPRLAKVGTFNLKKLEFFHPESVRHIHTFYHSGKLSMFRNLERIVFTDRYNRLDYLPSNHSQKLEEFSLATLKKLKEIDFCYSKCSKYGGENANDFKELIADILLLGRPGLKVFWCNIQVTDTSLLTEYELVEKSDGCLIGFQMKHWARLNEKNEFFWAYKFNWISKLSELGFEPRSEEFLSKFLARYSWRQFNLNGKVNEPELLLQLIARSPNLSNLIFENNNGLSQSFFDRMAEIVRFKSHSFAST